MKKINYPILIFVTLTTTVFATVYSDDFESYPVGYDIADSPDWTDENEDYIGVFLVEESGGNKYVTSDGEVYSYNRTGDVSDSRVSFDFMFTNDTDENQFVSAIFRLRDGGNAGYIVSCIKGHSCDYGFGDYIHVGILFESGEWYWLPNIYFLGDYFDADTWYHLDAEVYGHPVFSYNVSLNTDVNESGTVDPNNYVVTNGLPGIKVSTWYSNDIYIDNFEVDDDPNITGIKSASLGKIKASFR